MRRKTWDVLDRGDVPTGACEMLYSCPHCGREAALPVVGVPLAQLGGGGIVFDGGEGLLPVAIRCRACRSVFGTELPGEAT